MPCEQIGSFDATPLSAPSFDSNFDADTPLSKDDENHRRIIRHLYRRIGYGASLTDIENATVTQEDIDNGTQAEKTLGKLVDRLIATASGLSFPTEFDWLNRTITIPKRTQGGGEKPIPYATYNNMIVSYWINESITESVRSKLMLFWHNHFVTGETSHDKHYAMLRYFKLLHHHAFGRFKQFTIDIGRTPRMLKYLNGDENLVIRTSANGVIPLTYTNPNENYARELLELFTMGIEDKYGSLPTSLGGINYSAEDINQIAKAFTGWKVAANNKLGGDDTEMPAHDPEQFRFKYGNHDWSQKDFLRDPNPVTPYSNSYDYDPFVLYWKKYYPDTSENLTVVPGNNGEIVMAAPPEDATLAGVSDAEKKVKAGDEEYQKVHDLIFERREDQIAYFICEKLYKFYVYAGLDAENMQELTTPPTPGEENIHTYIKALADGFRDSDWDIAQLLKTIFKSQHFYDVGIIGGQIKSHLESAVSFFHTAGLQPSKWETDGMGVSTISNENSNTEPDYDYKYRLSLLEPHMTNAVTGEGANPSEVYDGLYRSHSNTHTIKISAACAEIGQTLLKPPNVAGWPGHHSWLNEYTLIKRRAILECYLTSESFGDVTDSNVTGYYDSDHGFRMVTKKKFLYLAKNLVDLEYGNSVDYINSGQVVNALWKHFFCVTPTPVQENEAITVYEDCATCTTPNVAPAPGSAEEEEMALRINGLLLHFIRQPEYHLT